MHFQKTPNPFRFHTPLPPPLSLFHRVRLARVCFSSSCNIHLFSPANSRFLLENWVLHLSLFAIGLLRPGRILCEIQDQIPAFDFTSKFRAKLVGLLRSFLEILHPARTIFEGF
ncbi:hypothetical protein Ancab_003370 [Ancistrocladus abbreviatus]